jgi:hypothetical protein
VTSKEPTNRSASIRARLLNFGKNQHTDFNQILVRYAIERLLYRLELSRHGQSFLLKGALLFTQALPRPPASCRQMNFH